MNQAQLQRHYSDFNSVGAASDAVSQSLTLVDGSVATSDAYESVNRLIHTTRQYLSMRDFSHRERFGKCDEWSESMISGIDDASPQVMSLIEQASANGHKVRVVAQIALEIDRG